MKNSGELERWKGKVYKNAHKLSTRSEIPLTIVLARFDPIKCPTQTQLPKTNTCCICILMNNYTFCMFQPIRCMFFHMHLRIIFICSLNTSGKFNKCNEKKMAKKWALFFHTNVECKINTKTCIDIRAVPMAKPHTMNNTIVTPLWCHSHSHCNWN